MRVPFGSSHPTSRPYHNRPNMINIFHVLEEFIFVGALNTILMDIAMLTLTGTSMLKMYKDHPEIPIGLFMNFGMFGAIGACIVETAYFVIRMQPNFIPWL